MKDLFSRLHNPSQAHNLQEPSDSTPTSAPSASLASIPVHIKSIIMPTQDERNRSPTYYSVFDFGPKYQDELAATASSAPICTPASTFLLAPAPRTEPMSTSRTSTPHSIPSPSRFPASQYNSAGWIQTTKGIYYKDEGERDEYGNVTILKDQCEDCGGRVVFATRGPWLLICRDCGEVQ
jgi:hypothetical protein